MRQLKLRLRHAEKRNVFSWERIRMGWYVSETPLVRNGRTEFHKISLHKPGGREQELFGIISQKSLSSARNPAAPIAAGLRWFVLIVGFPGAGKTSIVEQFAVLLSRSLDPPLKHRAVFPWEWEMPAEQFESRFPKAERRGEKPWMVGQFGFGAEAGHPFVRRVLEEMIKRSASFEADRCSDTEVLHSTGPDVVTTCCYSDRAKWKTLTLLKGRANEEAGEEPVYGADTFQRFGHYGRHLLNGGWLGGR